MLGPPQKSIQIPWFQGRTLHKGGHAQTQQQENIVNLKDHGRAGKDKLAIIVVVIVVMEIVVMVLLMDTIVVAFVVVVKDRCKHDGY